MAAGLDRKQKVRIQNNDERLRTCFIACDEPLDNENGVAV
jgi:hypothetical protein